MDNKDIYIKLQTLDISESFLYLFVIALMLSKSNIYILKGQAIDTLNNTDYFTTRYKHHNYLQLLSNRIFAIGTFYFLLLNYETYLETDYSNYDNKVDAWQNFIATFLTFYSLMLSGSNIDI